MPEIWLNYGITDVVLDIKAENLEQKIDSDGKILDDQAIMERLNTLDLSKPMELVVLHNSKSILKIFGKGLDFCSHRVNKLVIILRIDLELCKTTSSIGLDKSRVLSFSVIA